MKENPLEYELIGPMRPLKEGGHAPNQNSETARQHFNPLDSKQVSCDLVRERTSLQFIF